jgi:hypothetical protein
MMMNDCDVWEFMQPEDAWVYDKLILARRLGYACGPAGVAPKSSAEYIVRPISNYRMMGRGSKVMHIEAGKDIIPDGYFWCEVFKGTHFSFDYHRGQQTLAVEGVKDSKRTDRFSLWRKVNATFTLPDILIDVAKKYDYMNIEVIGNKIIEVHLRYNDDFRGHESNEIVPIWKENFYDSPCGDRIGFLLK